jgi:major membrane immunogen (membrane-anchored lipoprotein)
MKKLNLLIVIIILFACNKSKTELTGFGGFDIDSNFSSHEKFTDFKKTMPDEYYCNSLELSKDIGKVSDLNITTDNGKIIEVKFSSNENTNIDDIQKQFLTMEKDGKSKKFENEIAIFKTYSSQKERIFFIDVEYKNEIMKNGKPKHEFSYSNKKAIEEGDKLIKSMSSNNH